MAASWLQRRDATRVDHPGCVRARQGFTLIELIAVMVVMATLAVVAAPSLQSLRTSREAALRGELIRWLTLARAQAMATGEPNGVSIDAGAGVVSARRLDTASGVISPVMGPTGEPKKDLVLADRFPGVSITGFVDGGGGATYTMLWFAHTGEPELRDTTGLLIGPFTADATITLTGPGVVTVRRLTGLIE